MRITIVRKAHFNAAHRLHNPNWSEQKNKDIFGLCNSGNYHGHNYELEVYLTGEVNQETGYLFDLKDLKDIIKEEVEDRFDHKNLNLDTSEFKDMIPSTENLCYVIHGLLSKRMGSEFDVKIRLWETPRNGVEYPPIS